MSSVENRCRRRKVLWGGGEKEDEERNREETCTRLEERKGGTQQSEVSASTAYQEFHRSPTLPDWDQETEGCKQMRYALTEPRANIGLCTQVITGEPGSSASIRKASQSFEQHLQSSKKIPNSPTAATALAHSVEPADDEALEVELGGDAQRERQPERVVERLERSRLSAARDDVERRRLDLHRRR
eukprot:6184623-Pleurochrysis_carterae.AAC.1